MTEKRFNYTSERIGQHWSIEISDNQTKQPFDVDYIEIKDNYSQTRDNVKFIVELLNELHEENNLLKDIIKDIVIQLDANHTSHTYQMTIPINRVIYNELKRRLKETSFNEELRRFLE